MYCPSHPLQQLTKLHQLAMQQTPFTPLGQTTPAFPGTYPQALFRFPSLCTSRNSLSFSFSISSTSWCTFTPCPLVVALHADITFPFLSPCLYFVLFYEFCSMSCFISAATGSAGQFMVWMDTETLRRTARLLTEYLLLQGTVLYTGLEQRHALLLPESKRLICILCDLLWFKLSYLIQNYQQSSVMMIHFKNPFKILPKASWIELWVSHATKTTQYYVIGQLW